MTHDPAIATVDVDERVKSFIRSEVLFEDRNASLTNDTPLLDGVLDSMALMQVVSFLEEEFSIEVDDVEITRSNFTSVSSITALVTSKVG